MNENIEDLSISYTEGDVELIKELSKHTLSKGAWSTIIYKYQEWNAKNNEYGPIKFSIRRYQKRQGVYNQKSKFNISSIEQAKKLIAILQTWTLE